MHSWTNNKPACSCGVLRSHKIAVRTTADGQRLTVWSDGTLTHGYFGATLQGLGQRRSQWAKEQRRKAVMLMMDWMPLYDAAEVPGLIRAAEGTYRHDYSSDADRSRHARLIFEGRGR